MKSISDRIIVIGAGITGLSVAYYLNKAGHDEVTILDKGDGTDNCSYGNAGMIVPSHIVPLATPGVISKGLKWMLNAESPFYIHPRFSSDLLKWSWKFRKAANDNHVEAAMPVLKKLLTVNRQLLVELEESERLEFDFHKSGMLMLCKTEEGLEEEKEFAEKVAQLGIPVRMLSASEVHKKEPSVDPNIKGALYFPNDGHIHPSSLMEQLKKRLQNLGVGFQMNSEVSDLIIKNKTAHGVKLSDGTTIEGSEVVCCLGAWTSSLLRKTSIGSSIPMQAGKGYSLTIQSPPVIPKHCAVFAEEKVTMTPMNGSLRLAGTLEIVGTDRSINPRRVAGLKKTVCRYLPDFKEENLEDQPVWVGLRPCSPDGLPYVGRIQPYKNLYISTGHAMFGMSLGISSGKMIADLIDTGESKLSHPMTDPNRYH